MGLLQPFLAVALLVIKMKRSNSRTEWKNPGENRKLSTFPRYTRELRRLRKSWPLRTRARSLYLKPNIGDVVQPRYSCFSSSYVRNIKCTKCRCTGASKGPVYTAFELITSLHRHCTQTGHEGKK